MADVVGKAAQVVMIACLVGMAVSSFRMLDRTSRTDEPAPPAMRLGAVSAVLGLLAVATLFLLG